MPRIPKELLEEVVPLAEEVGVSARSSPMIRGYLEQLAKSLRSPIEEYKKAREDLWGVIGRSLFSRLVGDEE